MLWFQKKQCYLWLSLDCMHPSTWQTPQNHSDQVLKFSMAFLDFTIQQYYSNASNLYMHLHHICKNEFWNQIKSVINMGNSNPWILHTTLEHSWDTRHLGPTVVLHLITISASPHVHHAKIPEHFRTHFRQYTCNISQKHNIYQYAIRTLTFLHSVGDLQRLTV